MEIKKGRLLDHVHICVSDIKTSRQFYGAIFDVLGIELFIDTPEFFACDELFVSKGDVSHIHLAFQAPDREIVERFFAAAIKAGGTDNGAPGERPYHPGYYAAYVRDPDGNNIEMVFHGEATRSAEAVVIRPVVPK